MHKTLNFFLTVSAIFFTSTLYAQFLAKLEVELQEAPLFAFPVQVALDPITHTTDSLLVLIALTGDGEKTVPFQVDHTVGGRVMYWMIEKGSPPGTMGFELRQDKKPNDVNAHLTAEKDEKVIVLRHSGKDLWQYNHAKAEVPEGVDKAYERSGFVHPFYSPTGKRLTRIQPPDHYHHYGLWNPWTRALYKGDTVDFWNLKDRQGTVRYANTLNTIDGPVYTGYEVLHEHVVFKNRQIPEVAMVETQGTRIYALPGDDYYLADISISLNPSSKDEVLLLEYRYGSLGWRTTEKWDRYNSEVLTSEGLGRVEADGSLATWCIVQGEIDEEYAGVVMMSHPTNYNHPEPLRIWPIDMYNRGDMYANFAPTKDKDWLIKPGQKHVLTYRFLVTSRKLSEEEAGQSWKYFAHPPQVKVLKTEQLNKNNW